MKNQELTMYDYYFGEANDSSYINEDIVVKEHVRIGGNVALADIN